MHGKVTLTKNFGIKLCTKKVWAPDPNTGVMKENKAIAQ